MLIIYLEVVGEHVEPHVAHRAHARLRVVVVLVIDVFVYTYIYIYICIYDRERERVVCLINVVYGLLVAVCM